MYLHELKIGSRAKVLDYNHIPSDLRRKLINLGLHRQAILTILRKAPLNGPWQLQVDKTSFSIRPHYISDIHVGLVE
jgi:Fe2+ transport system protein FeoA